MTYCSRTQSKLKNTIRVFRLSNDVFAQSQLTSFLMDHEVVMTTEASEKAGIHSDIDIEITAGS